MFIKKIFIHIPKNAGTTIRLSPILKDRIIEATPDIHKNKEYSDAVLAHMNSIGDHHGYEHARWRDIRAGIRMGYDAFAVIRNPWDRVASRYLFAKKVTEIEKKAPPGKHKIDSFEHFLEERFEWGNMKYMWHRAIRGWYNAYDYVTDIDGNLKCDMLRFENLNNDLCAYFKLPEMSRARNVTGLVRDYKTIYTPETIQIVADWYQKDIETWGFDFDTGAKKNYWNKNGGIY